MKKLAVKAIVTTLVGGIGTIFTALSCACLYLRFGWNGWVKMGGSALYIIGMFLTAFAVDEAKFRVDKYYHEQKEGR